MGDKNNFLEKQTLDGGLANLNLMDAQPYNMFSGKGGDPLKTGSRDLIGLGGGDKGPKPFDWSDAMNNFSMGAEGVMGLANAYTAYKQLGLMEDQLNFQKGLANRNIANSAATTNRQLTDRANMAAQMTSGAEYGTPEHLAAKERLTTKVDGSPVG